MLGRGSRSPSRPDSSSSSSGSTSGSSPGRTPDPRPNVLAGQVAPNALSTRGARQAANQSSIGGTRTPLISPNRTATAAAIAPAAASGTVAPRARTPRPFSIWTLVVAGFIVINLARGFLAAGSPDPTEPPPTTAPHTAQPGSSGAGGAIAGIIEFGTLQHDDCSLEITANAFDVGADVLWWAHFTRLVAAKATVEWSIEHDGAVLDSGTGPGDTPSGPWDSICSSFPVRYFAAGDYTMEIWTSGHGELLSKGTYTLRTATPTSGASSPSATA